MKKITIIGSCLFCTLFLTNNAQINIPKNNIETNVIIDYKKASDSLLQIAEKNNLEALKNLEEVKKLQYLKEQQNLEIINVRKEIKNNLQLIIDLFKQKNKETKNNELIVGNEKIKIDSIYVKGSLLKKSKWIYEITFNDGSKKILE